MDNSLFTLLIHFLLAHLVADFVLQTKKMVENKRWFSLQMGFHLLMVFASTWIITGKLNWALIVTPIHWIIDGIKTTATKRKWGTEQQRFLTDQGFHILSIVLIWLISSNKSVDIIQIIRENWFDYPGSLIILAYTIVIWPVAYCIKYATSSFNKKTRDSDEESKPQESIQQGGKLIGQFERIIILTLVLLNQYSAIGFLLTGKSILRFSNQSEIFSSEYVLVGTLMSYSLTILIGAVVNLLI